MSAYDRSQTAHLKKMVIFFKLVVRNSCLSLLKQKHFCLFSICHLLSLNSSTIDKLREWCLERMVEPRAIWAECVGVSLTTLWAATTRHCHTQQTVETIVLTMYLPWEKGGVGREKSSKTTVQQRKTRGMTWHPTLSGKLHSAPAWNHRPPHTPTLWYTAGQQYCFAFNLA